MIAAFVFCGRIACDRRAATVKKHPGTAGKNRIIEKTTAYAGVFFLISLAFLALLLFVLAGNKRNTGIVNGGKFILATVFCTNSRQYGQAL